MEIRQKTYRFRVSCDTEDKETRVFNALSQSKDSKNLIIEAVAEYLDNHKEEDIPVKTESFSNQILALTLRTIARKSLDESDMVSVSDLYEAAEAEFPNDKDRESSVTKENVLQKTVRFSLLRLKDMNIISNPKRGYYKLNSFEKREKFLNVETLADIHAAM